jgi:hypothetical protein
MGNSVTCTINCDHRIAAKLYMVYFRYVIVIVTLKGGCGAGGGGYYYYYYYY